MLLMSYSNCIRVKVYIHRLGNRAPEGTVDSAQREFRDVLVKALGDDGARKRERPSVAKSVKRALGSRELQLERA